MSKKDWDTAFRVLIAVGSSGVSSEGILHRSSPVAVKDHTQKPQRKQSSCRQAILITKKAGITFLSFCPWQEKYKYIQAVTHRFIPDLQYVFSSNESKAYIYVLGRYHCSLLHTTNRETYNL